MDKRERKKSARKLLKLAGSEKWWFAAACAAALVVVLISLIIPMIMSGTVDYIIDDREMKLPLFIMRYIENIGGREYIRENLWTVGVLILLLSLVNMLGMSMRSYCSGHASEGLAKNMRDELMGHFQKLDFKTNMKYDTGDVIQRCTTDVEIIRNFAAMRVVELARGISIVILAVALMCMVNVKMMFVTVSLVPFVGIGSVFYFRMIQKRFLASDEAEGIMCTVLQENLSGVRVVRAFGRQADEIRRFNEKNEDTRVKALKLSNILSIFWGITDFVGYVQVALTLSFGVILHSKGELNVGELIMFTSYAGMMVWPVRQLGRILSDFGKAKVSWERLYDILKNETEEESGKVPYTDGDIVFENVSFSYNGRTDVLKNLSFTVRKGETLAILGGTGSGKSTLVQLLARIYDPTGGRITIGGTDITDVSRADVRENVALMLQESFLYSRTLKENIIIARPDAGDEKIDQAVRISALKKVVETFRDGYDTEIGEKGITLSGGQKQRVAIARSVLRETPVIILDDSLSAVDTKTDAEIRQGLKEREGDQTTIIISHRTGTLMQADKLLVLENGEIVQFGTPEDVLKEEGLFRDLFNIQTELRRSVSEVM